MSERSCDLRDAGKPYPRTCAVCGLGPCQRPLGTKPLNGTAVVWVLWHRYGDGSGAHIERVYVDEIRAQEDYALLTDGTGKASSNEWSLDKVPFIPNAYK